MKKILVRILKLMLALCISGAFAYFAFRRVNLTQVYEIVLGVKYPYVFFMFLTVLGAQVLRSYRWGVMLHPIVPLSQRILFPVSSIGFMFIVLLPARLGEIVRPYLIHQNGQINMTTAMATVILERILDSFFILIFLGMTIISLELPSWVIHGATYTVIILVTISGLIFLGSLNIVSQQLRRQMEKYFPKRFNDLAHILLERFYEGMGVLGKGRQALVIILLTAGIWGTFVLSNLLLIRAFQLPLGAFAAMSVLAITALGISVPAGPGFIGNFHFFCILGLSFFGIEKEIALGYAMVNHVVMMGTIILLGVLFLNISHLNLGFKNLGRLRSLARGMSIE